MAEIYLVGRSAFSENAKLFARYVGKSVIAYQMLSYTSFVCTKKIEEKTGYKQLGRFYNWLTRATLEEVNKLIEKHNAFRYLIFAELTKEEFIKELLSYPKPAIESAMRKNSKSRPNSVIAEDFLEQCRKAYFEKLDSEVDKESEWYGALPVLEKVSSSNCPHHTEDAYCYMIRKLRDSDPMTDPMPDETIANIIAWEESINEEIING